MNILVTGGAGFIGSHTVVELLEAGHSPFIVDNFSNSNEFVLDNLKSITGHEIIAANLDVRNTAALSEFMAKHDIEAVIHFAAFKAVGESTQKPLLYHTNNIGGLLSVLESMKKCGVEKLIFSSSCTVYGDPDSVPVNEQTPLKDATNPYGATKQIGERILNDMATYGGINSVLLRYFNPIGAHKSGMIGELPIGVPNNLVPFVSQAAAGIRDKITVFGDDYDTPDGSGVRDYIHVVDLAKAHVKAVEYVGTMDKNIDVFNLGTGTGSSVLEVIKTFEDVNNIKVPFEIGPRRSGDIAETYAAVGKAKDVLGWETALSLEDALRDTWRWQQKLKEMGK
jgi:UDP-glucose 4-epimerase